MIKTVPTSTLTKQKINPYPGLQISAAGGLTGTIRSVTAGRTRIDFNHPLADKDLMYEITLHEIVTDVKEKVNSLVLAELGLAAKDYSSTVEGKTISLKMSQALPDEIKKMFIERVQALLSGFTIRFV